VIGLLNGRIFNNHKLAVGQEGEVDGCRARPQVTNYRMVTDKHVCPFGLTANDLLRRESHTVETLKASPGCS
jgi:hypothetical protein